MVNKKLRNITFYFLIILISWNQAWGQDTTTTENSTNLPVRPMRPSTVATYSHWSEFMGKSGSFIDGLTNNGNLSSFLFNQYANIDTNIHLWGKTFNDIFPIGVGLILGVNRRVIENNNINRNYTIIDTFKLGVNPHATMLLAPAVSFGASANFFVEISNVRQLNQGKYSNLLPIDQIKKLLAKAREKREKNRPPLSIIEEENRTYTNFVKSFKDYPLKSAQFGRIWNPITQIFRLPLKHTRALAMEDYEIISYSLNGGINLSACIGVPGRCGSAEYKNNMEFTELGINVTSVSVFMQGSHRISVLKEGPESKGNYVQVMLSRIIGGGLNYNIGGWGTNLSILLKQKIKEFGEPLDKKYIDYMADRGQKVGGNLILEKIKPLNATSKISFKPFSIDFNIAKNKLYDSIYRFNLDTEEGRVAYNHACLGNFKEADLKSRDENGDVIWGMKNFPVTRINHTTEVQSNYARNINSNFLLVNFWKNKNIKNSLIEIENENGKNRYFETEILNDKQLQALFLFRKGNTHRFFVTIDEKEFLKTNGQKGTSASVDIKRYNLFSTPKEYMEYAMEFETLTKQNGVFPFPLFSQDKRPINESLGNTGYNLSLNFDNETILNLVNYPEDKMWEALEEAFNIKEGLWTNEHKRRGLIAGRLAVYAATLPVTMLGQRLDAKDDVIVANIKHSRWIHLKNELLKGPKVFAKELGKFFDSGDYGSEMINLLRVISGNKKNPFKGSFTSFLLPNHTVYFSSDSNFPITRVNKDSFKFESYLRTLDSLDNKLSGLSALAIPPFYFKVIFNLEEVPKRLFVGLYKFGRVLSVANRTLVVDTIENKNNLFKKGLNIFYFSAKNKNNPFYKIAEQLDFSKKAGLPARYRLNIAANFDDKNWTKVSSTVFQVMPINPDLFKKDFISTTITEESICLGRFSEELKLFLGERPLYICPKTDSRNPDGTCKSGMIPYSSFKNRSNPENLLARDQFIDEHCPRLIGDYYLAEVLKNENICQGYTAPQIIKFLGEFPFYVCPKKDTNRDQNRLCIAGMIPYNYDSNSKDLFNIRSRDEWLAKNCGL